MTETPRTPDRFLEIVTIDGAHAVMRPIALDDQGMSVPLNRVRRTRVRLDRLRPTSTGYRYVGEAR